MVTEKLKAWLEKVEKNFRFMEYIYLLYFATGLYLLVVPSEYDSVRTFIAYINNILFIVCLLQFLYYAICVFLKDRNIKFIFLKGILVFMTIFIVLIQNILAKVILGENGLKNVRQIGSISIWLIIISCMFFAVILIKHAKLNGFWKNRWVSLVFCLYLLVCYTFALVYYACDYYSINTYSDTFSYSDKLEKDIRSRNFLNSNDLAINSFQKNDIKLIINSGKDNIVYMKVDIGGQEILLTNEEIGKNWAGYYYENLVVNYNSYSIESKIPLKLTFGNLNRASVSTGRDYTKLLNKDYVLAKIVLFNSPIKGKFYDFPQAILLTDYNVTLISKSEKVKEMYLVFESDNFDNYKFTASELGVNIFLDCLSESNTLLDSMITDIVISNNSQSSNSLFDYIYYSAIVITTIGFGDIIPISMLVRTLSVIEAFIGLIIMGLFLAKAFESKPVMNNVQLQAGLQKYATDLDTVEEIPTSNKSSEKTVTEYLMKSDADLKNRYEAIRVFLLTLGDDVQEKILKHYIAFRRIKNFACIQVHPQMGRITVYVKVNPEYIEIEPGFTRDVRKIGHSGTGDLELVINNDEQLEKAKTFLLRSYESS